MQTHTSTCSTCKFQNNLLYAEIFSGPLCKKCGQLLTIESPKVFIGDYYTSSENSSNIDTINLSTNLDSARKKLLDLSKRNRLLNFRKTSLVIPIVDEQPSQVFEYLVTKSKPMSFTPSLDPLENNQINIFENKENKSETDTALDLNEELPLPNSSSESEKHTDDQLQTPFDKEILEAKLRKVQSTAKTVIEETGTNQLFLAMGFLKWRESTSSEEYYLAPLILIPVELENNLKKIGNKLTSVYEIKYSDEDLLINLTLAEKLKSEFNIILPDFDEDLDPEKYFELVRDVIAEEPGWELQRKMVLGFFRVKPILS